MKTSRRKFSSFFKAKVTIEVLKERETTRQIAAHYEVHPTQISIVEASVSGRNPRGLW